MTDNELLEQLFAPVREVQMEDNGFTERVMNRIPSTRTQRLSRLWTAFCVVVAVVLFILMRGWQSIAYWLLMLVNTPPSPQALLTMFLSVGVIGLLAVAEIASRERYSLL